MTISVVALVAFLALRQVLGAGIASTCVGWMVGTSSTLYHLTKKNPLSESSKRSYLYYGFFLILTSLLCAYIVTLLAAEIRMPLLQSLNSVSPTSPQASVITLKLYKMDALVELLKNTFLLVAAALGANFIFSGLTLKPEQNN